MTNNVQISDREREILQLVARGATNQQIADQLNISVHTVKVHLRNIFSKIGVVSRTEATLYAIRNGIVSVDAPGDIFGEAAQVKPALAEESTPIALIPVEVEEAAPTTLAAPDTAPASPAAAASTASAIPAPSPLRRRWQALALVAGLVLAGALVAGWLLSRLQPPLTQPTAAAPTSGSEPSAEGRWIAHAPVPTPRQAFALVANPSEGRLYVIGGRHQGQTLPALDRYDPRTRLWVSLADMNVATSAMQAAELRGRIYVPGGELASGGVSNRLEAYDPREQRWYELAPLPAPRSRYGLAVWEGKLYLLGGWDGERISAEVFVYDPVGDAWSSGPALPSARQYAAASVVAGQLYLIGGEGPGGPLRESLRLDVEGATERWQFLPPLPQPIGRPQAVALLNSLLAINGQDRAVWQYDAASDAWVPYPITADVGANSSVSLLNTSLYFVGDDQTPEPGAVMEYRVLYTIFVPGAGGPPGAP
ncbi:MAG: LuxR C-terminal-related transcriptional regulator [Oscillochloridaceae bacterium]|nr:LuxR C-terminal-related transcriptional regulator [Chloroflexaceae bacterium]MDW8389410.1 LuxR C-terminal-related transcriptional regulator [Oscillochloridaceae bacterium]